LLEPKQLRTKHEVNIVERINQAWLKNLQFQEQSWMVQEWLKNNDGSRTRMVQEQSWLKHNDGSRTIYGGSKQ
jgi:hypothetical protein